MLGLASCWPRNGDLSVTTDGAALIYAGGKAKEVDMASIKQERTLHDTGMMDSSKTASHADGDREQADFELDDVLRGLALEKWFATAEEGVPIWVF
jgi:hypothetical protein